MIGTFAALAADRKLSHGEALRKAMLTMLDNPTRPHGRDGSAEIVGALHRRGRTRETARGVVELALLRVESNGRNPSPPPAFWLCGLPGPCAPQTTPQGSRAHAADAATPVLSLLREPCGADGCRTSLARLRG